MIMPILDLRPKTTDAAEDTVDEETTTEEGKDAEDAQDGLSEGTSPEDSSTSDDEAGDTVVTPDGGSEDEGDDVKTEISAIEALRIQKEALLKDISGLRGDRRDLRANPAATQSLIVDDPSKDPLADVDPNVVGLVERVIQAKGYAKKEDVAAMDHKKTVKAVTDAWLVAHPEYKPENDPEDAKWNALTAITSMFATPSDPTRIAKILDMAHKELNQAPVLPSKNRAEVTAQQEKLKVSSKTGGGNGGKPAPSTKSPMPVGIKGMTQDEWDAL